MPQPAPTTSEPSTVPAAAPTTVIAPGPTSEALWVYNTGDVGLRVRSSPQITAHNPLGTVSEGTRFLVAGSPQSADGYTWRQVRLEGWSAANWLTPAPSAGNVVQISGTGEAGLRVRSSPQINGDNILGKVFDGTRVQVLEGPQTADGYQWWRVKLEGWSAVEFLRRVQVDSSLPPVSSPGPDRRVIVMPGICSSSGDFTDPDKWAPGLKRWLSLELGLEDRPPGDPKDQIIGFSYSDSSWDATYDKVDTLLPVGNAASNLAQIYLAYPDAKFDIIAHSLGGVVALHALQLFPILQQRTKSVITVSSPLRGSEDPRRLMQAYTPLCCGEFEELFRTVRYPVYDDLDQDSPIIKSIVDTVWSDVTVVTVANTQDVVVPEGRATLEEPSVHCWIIGASWVLDPVRAAIEKKDGHSIILEEREDWFRNLVKLAHIGRLKPASCR